MRLLAWNIRHGGGRRVEAICQAILRQDADVVVLTEFREGRSGERIRAALGSGGWSAQASSQPPSRTNGILVASRMPFAALPARRDVPCGAWRWLECVFSGLTLVAAYFPLNRAKLPYWDWFLREAEARASRPCVLIGDFNTGKHFIDEVGATFVGPEYLGRLEELAYADAWRRLHPEAREYTWFSHRGNGFRLDYAFLSPALAPRLRRACHSQQEREERVSDQAALLVEIDRH